MYMYNDTETSRNVYHLSEQIWGLTVYSLLYSFPGEHPRSSFFKNIGQVSYFD